MYDRELEEVGSRGALRMDRSGCTWEAAEINRKQKPIAVELMTSGMAKERKDEMIVMKVLMRQGGRRKKSSRTH